MCSNEEPKKFFSSLQSFLVMGCQMTSSLPPFGYPLDCLCSPTYGSKVSTSQKDMLLLHHDSTNSEGPILGGLSVIIAIVAVIAYYW